MSVLVASPTQLQAVVARARSKADGDLPILVRADPDVMPALSPAMEGATVAGSRSPLEIRSLVTRRESGTLVVLTDCYQHDLGEDLMARVAGGRVWPLDRWETVKELFSARTVSRELSRKSYLADALIEAQPLSGYPPVRTGVLDVETALAALLREYLKLPEDLDTLDGFLHWATRKDAAHLLSAAPSDVFGELHRLLVERYGIGTDVVLAVLQAGLGDDMIPLGLAGSVIHGPSATDASEARLRLKLHLGDRPLEAEAWRQFATAVERYVRDSEDGQHVSGWLSQSDVFLDDFNGTSLAHLSDLIPSGSEQRIQQAATALAGWAAAPGSSSLADSAHEAIDIAARHRHADKARIERMRMAARLIRRGALPMDWGHRLKDASRAYQSDGAWIDWARTHVSRGETDPTLKTLYADLVARADAQRSADNQSFTKFGSAVSGQLSDDILGIESMMSDVVAPIAEDQPVLVIVLDGMGWPSFLEVQRAVASLGWVWWRDKSGRFDRPAVAVLPTVTEFSRTSLFAGVVRKGVGESERRAFEAHQELLGVSSQGKPPVLHHKAGLRSGGLDAVPEGLLADIADAQRQVVAVVLNNIDERLKDVVGPPEGWGLPELDPMRWLLRQAREAGRVVIFTADHGHILDRNAVQVTAPGGGERWKVPTLGVADGEVEVSGPRVIGSSGSPGDKVVLPWVEQRHYGTKRNGYHGGFTPQEVLIPVAILSADDLPDGWVPVSFPDPAWWHHRPKVEPVATPAPKSTKKAPQEQAPTLFDPVELPDGGSWLDRVVAALEDFRTPQIRLTENEIRAMLQTLADHGGMAVTETRLAEVSGLPAPRIGRYVSQLQQLVNIDGYGVVVVAGREVRFDQALLERQLGLS